MKNILIILLALLIYSCNQQQGKVEGIETAFITTWNTEIDSIYTENTYYELSGDKAIKLGVNEKYDYNYK